MGLQSAYTGPAVEPPNPTVCIQMPSINAVITDYTIQDAVINGKLRSATGLGVGLASPKQAGVALTSILVSKID